MEFLLRHPPVMLRMLEGLANQTRISILNTVTLVHRPIRDRLVLNLRVRSGGHRATSRDNTVMTTDDVDWLVTHLRAVVAAGPAVWAGRGTTLLQLTLCISSTRWRR